MRERERGGGIKRYIAVFSSAYTKHGGMVAIEGFDVGNRRL